MDKGLYIETAAAARELVVARARCLTGSAEEAEDVAQEVLLKLWLLHEKITSADGMLRLANVMARNISLNV